VINIEKINEVYVCVDCEKEYAYEIRDIFSCYAKNYKFHPRFKARIWDGRISFFDIKTHLLPIGLLGKLVNYLTEKNYPFKFDFDISQFFDEEITDDNLQIFFDSIFIGDLKPRDYQIEAIKNSLYNKRGVVESPTGSGKSLIIYSIIRFLIEQVEGNILLVVPNISLVEQMFSDFSEYGWKEVVDFVDILYSGKKITGKKILVSTWQSIYTKGEDFFSQFNAVLMDECHGLSLDSKSLKSIMIKCSNAYYKFGFTGTLPDDDIDMFTIYGYLGPKIFELTSGELIDKGVLAKITIANLLYKYPIGIINEYKNRSYPEEERLVESHKGRYKILNFIFSNINDKENTLILCKHIEHLKLIEQYLIDNLDDKYKVCVIYGEISATKREELRKLMEIEDNMILVGTYQTMAVGINIKKIHNVVFFSSYKSKIKVLQSIGRGLRTHESKDQMILWDVVDDLRVKLRTGRLKNNYLFDHFEERLKYYDKQGFDYHNLQITDIELQENAT